MRGDEAGLGTPCEDMVSLAAMSALDEVPTRLVACIGFGIDAFHGVCHAQFLENVAQLSERGALLGAIALLPTMPEVRCYLDAVSHAESVTREPSIVNASIASAIEGKFGNYHRTERTGSSTLFINPLMSLVWAFDLADVARTSLYLHLSNGTQNIFDVMVRIEAFLMANMSRCGPEMGDNVAPSGFAFSLWVEGPNGLGIISVESSSGLALSQVEDSNGFTLSPGRGLHQESAGRATR